MSSSLKVEARRRHNNKRIISVHFTTVRNGQRVVNDNKDKSKQ